MTDALSREVYEELKEYIDRENGAGMEERLFELLDETEFLVTPDWPWILMKLFIHACLKRQKATAAALNAMFAERADPISKIAYKHSMAYGSVLLRRGT